MISHLHAGFACHATRPLRSVCCGRPLVARGTPGTVLSEDDRDGRHWITVRWEDGSVGNYLPEEVEIGEKREQ